jgi:carotenoid 1,2-hydratase
VSRSSIALADPRTRLDLAFLEAPGGFAWWYADALDASGTGFVLIWSYGLPFIPGSPERPADHLPALNLALYREGRPDFYLLTRYRPEEVQHEGGLIRMDRSRFETAFDGERLRVRVNLDCDVPRGAPLLGQIELSGSVPRFASERGSPHLWSPLSPSAHCTARFSCGPRTLAFEGPAYHDFNASEVPLTDLGIERWSWGRLSGPGESAMIYYVLWRERGAPEAYAIELGEGRARVHREVHVEEEEPARGRYGLPYSRRLALSAAGAPLFSVRTVRVVEDGPFYLRSMVEFAGRAGLGFSEWVLPARIDVPWQRSFVRMRIHDRSGPNSWLLPLFSGSHGLSRIARLLGRRR